MKKHLFPLVLFALGSFGSAAFAQVAVSSQPRIDTVSSDCQQVTLKRDERNVIFIDVQAAGVQAVKFNKIALPPYTLVCRNLKLEIQDQKIILNHHNTTESFSINYLEPFEFHFVLGP